MNWKVGFICLLNYIFPQEYYDQSDEFSEEEEEGEMVIDENPVEKERSITSNFNNNEIKISAFGQGFANSLNIW